MIRADECQHSVRATDSLEPRAVGRSQLLGSNKQVTRTIQVMGLVTVAYAALVATVTFYLGSLLVAHAATGVFGHGANSTPQLLPPERGMRGRIGSRVF